MSAAVFDKSLPKDPNNIVATFRMFECDVNGGIVEDIAASETEVYELLSICVGSFITSLSALLLDCRCSWAVPPSRFP
jgi:hypothetical protein